MRRKSDGFEAGVVAAELSKLPFSDEFLSGSGSDYLLHLTRLIDRTSDLYRFAPVSPVDKGQIAKSGKLAFRAAFPKVRVRDNFTQESWRRMVSEFDDDNEKTNFPKFSSLRKPELNWRKPDSRKLRQIEPAASFDLADWEVRTENLVSSTFSLDNGLQVPPQRRILLLPEFSFPPFELRSQRNDFFKKIQGKYLIDSTVGNKGNNQSGAPSHAARKRNFMFLGSYHDIESGHNIGVTLPFGLTPIDPTVRSSFQDQANDGIYYQRKRAASKKLGEVLSPVDSLEFPVYVTDVGRIAVLICSDIYDVSLFLGLVRYNLRCLPGAEIDYVLVPAFNRSRKLVESCKQLSFLMNNVVIYTTSYEIDSKAATRSHSNHSHCFICGRNEEDMTPTGFNGEDSGILTGIIEARPGETKPSEGQPESTKVGFVDYIIDADKVALLRLLTRKKYSKALKEGSRRTHIVHRSE